MTDVTCEQWLPVVGYEGLYEVSDHGRVRSLDRRVQVVCANRTYWNTCPGCVLSPASRRSGHLHVSLRQNLQQTTHSVHRLVAFAFAGEPPDGHEVCHGDGDPTNNHSANLRWDTRTENALDTVRHGHNFNKRKTHCPRGHPLRDPNLSRSGRPGSVACLACARGRSNVWTDPSRDLQREADRHYAAIMGGSEAGSHAPTVEHILL